MTFEEKLFFFILTLNSMVATTIPLEFSLVPKINCHDLNENDSRDFIAFSNLEFPRSIYHLELSNGGIEILWQFTMPESKKGYFTDMILDDFDNDGIIELITIAYQDEGEDIFYIFSVDTMGFYSTPPIITGLQNTLSINIRNPQKLFPMTADENDRSMFLMTQGSPNRQIIICEYLDGEIIARGSVGEKYLSNTMAPINIALGDFNSDGSEDIFILDNGFTPTGHFIFSDGSEEESALPNYPRLRLLNEKGIDLNFDGSDDLVFISRNGELMSNIWGAESISLSENKIQDIIINAENGFIYLTSISQTGKIGNYSIDPLTQSILSSEFDSTKFTNNYNRTYALATSQGIIITHNGDDPEIWTTNQVQKLISSTPPTDYIQRIYQREPDYVVNLGKNFYHEIKWDDGIDLRNFTEENIPSGMEFDLNNVGLDWKPKIDQLGYHQLSYSLDLRQKGSLEMDTEEGRKVVSQTEFEIHKNYSHLIYVNDPTKLKLSKNHITIVNSELFEWTIPVYDENADAHLNVKKISGNNKAIIKLIEPNIILVPDTLSVSHDTVDVDTLAVESVVEEEKVIMRSEVIIDSTVETLDNPSYIDTVKTEFEEFTEHKMETESDPLKRKKLEETDDNFKIIKEEYQEKLKTHKKIIRDGKNIWLPIDSLAQPSDSIVMVDTAELSDSTIVDTSLLEELILDTLALENKFEEFQEDTNYVEIPYKKLIAHQIKFLWQPKVKPGNYDFIISVSDRFTSDTASFFITVHPEIDLSMNQVKYNATVDEMFTAQIILEQTPRSQNFIYDLINAPENMKIDTSGNINWVPIPTQIDDYSFEISVSDGIASNTIPINIYVNAPPVISSRPPKIFFLPDGEQLNFQLESFDLNSNTSLEWKLLSGPINMSISPKGALIWNNTKLGHHPYEIQLNDKMDSVQWKADIYVNATPEITSKPITMVAEGMRYEYTLTAWDANSMSPYDPLSDNKVTFSLVQGPDDMNIDENNILNWNTENVPLGEYMVAITASDGVDDDIQVFPVFINSFPVIISSDSIIVQMGKDLKFQMESTDKNPTDTLTYHIDPLLGNMVMELHSGLLTWTPEKKDLGVNIFRLQVKDGHDLNGRVMPFKIFVYDLPRITSDLSREAFTDMEYTAFLTAEDMNGKKLDGPESIVIDSASFNYYNLSQYARLFKWTPRDVDKGSHALLIKLTDDFGFTAYHRHNFTVFSNPCIHCNKEETAPADTTGK